MSKNITNVLQPLVHMCIVQDVRWEPLPRTFRWRGNTVILRAVIRLNYLQQTAVKVLRKKSFFYDRNVPRSLFTASTVDVCYEKRQVGALCILSSLFSRGGLRVRIGIDYTWSPVLPVEQVVYNLRDTHTPPRRRQIGILPPRTQRGAVTKDGSKTLGSSLADDHR